MGRRNLDRYTTADWREHSQTARQILLNGWPVISECDLCGVRLKVDVRVIVWARGPAFSLWGAKAACKRVGCPGRVTFYLTPHGAAAAIAMTARPG